MDFMGRLDPVERQRLLQAAESVVLARGEALIRRGERGGDVYRLESGTLEVLDTRRNPPVVLDTVEPGTLVGEVAFLDRSTRTADVRAAEPCVCLRWSQATLEGLLDADPALGRSVYRALADLVVGRSRHSQSLVEVGALGAPAGAGRVDDDVARIVGPARAVLMIAEPALRVDADRARLQVHQAMDQVRLELHMAFTRRSSAERRALGQAVARELHPYLIRSHLGELAMDRPSGQSEDPLAMAHLHRGRPEGDGGLGEIIDEYLLQTPTGRSLRERDLRVAALAREDLPPQARVLLLNAGRGGMPAALADALREGRGPLTLVEGDEDGLLRAQDGLRTFPAELLRAVQVDLPALVLGGWGPAWGAQDRILIAGLVDYLPDRALSAFLRMLSGWLRPGGRILLSALAPCDDDPVFRYLLRWPLVRRRPAALLGLAERAGLRTVHCDSEQPPTLSLVLEPGPAA